MEDDQQFCLRWNNHQSTLISVFDNLLASETLVDCTLAAEGKHLKAHKVVLSACSPYFASLLKEQYDKHPIFILKDVKYQELRYMMDYMYRGEVNISQDQLAALLKAAESLQIKGLSDNRPSVPKPEQQQQQQQQHQHQHQHAHHRATLPTNVGSVSGVVPKYPGSNYTLEQTKRTRLSGRTMGSIDTSEMDSREGSSSPSRKHRKMRRKSNENAMNDTHDNSNSSQLLQSNQQQQQHLQQQQQQIVNANVVAGLSGVGAITAAASALAASSAAGAVLHSGPSLAAAAAAAAAASSVVPTSSGAGGGGSSIKKTDSLKATSQTDAMNIIENQTAGGSNMSIIASGSVTDAVSDHHHHHQTLHHHQYQAHHTDTTTGTDNKMTHKQKLQQQQQQQPSSKDIISANQSELVIEPKSEYDDEANDEAVEDLTLDEEDMGMDDLDQKAGPSQGGEGSSQGYAPWQHDQSQDEILLNAQEAQQRDPQGISMITSLLLPHLNEECANNMTECAIISQTLPSCHLTDEGHDFIILDDALQRFDIPSQQQQQQQQQQQPKQQQKKQPPPPPEQQQQQQQRREQHQQQQQQSINHQQRKHHNCDMSIVKKQQHQSNEGGAIIQTHEQLLASMVGEYLKDPLDDIQSTINEDSTKSSNSVNFLEDLPRILSPLNIEYLEDVHVAATVNGQEVIDQASDSDLISLIQYGDNDHDYYDNNDNQQMISYICDSDISCSRSSRSSESTNRITGSSLNRQKNRNGNRKGNGGNGNRNKAKNKTDIETVISSCSNSSNSNSNSSSGGNASSSSGSNINSNINCGNHNFLQLPSMSQSPSSISSPSIVNTAQQLPTNVREICYQRFGRINRNLSAKVHNFKCHLCSFSCSWKEILLEHFREKHPT